MARKGKMQIANGIKLSADKHKKLLDFLLASVNRNRTVRESLVARYSVITKKLNGYLELSANEEKLQRRELDNQTTAIPEQKYTVALGHLEDVITNVMNILFPPGRMYGALELKKERQDIAAAFSSVLNQHAEEFGHYTAYKKMVTSAVVFNLGAVEYNWREDLAGAMVVRTGSAVSYLDPYNLILDYAAPVDNYALEAEYYGYVDRKTSRYLERKKREGYFFFDEDLYSDADDHINTQFGEHYFDRPAIRPKGWFSDCHKDKRAGFQLHNFLSTGETVDLTKPGRNEVITICHRLVPSEWGLGADKDYQIWRFNILNATRIIRAERVAEHHGVLPIGITSPKAMDGWLNSKGLSEFLIPFQDLMSNYWNLGIKDLRNSVYGGLKLYDQDMIRLNEIKDPSTGWIPVSRDNDDRRFPIQNAVAVIQENKGHASLDNEIAAIHQFLQKMIPTDLTQVMASLNRAGSHQSRVVSNAASRSIFAIAKAISEEALTIGHYIMTQNTMALQPTITVIGPDGEEVELSAAAFKESKIKIGISDGLKGLDLIAVQDTIDKMIQYTLQSRRSQEQYDVVRMMQFSLEMQGARINPGEFKFKNPWDKLDDQQKAIAFELLQKASQEAQNK